MGCTCGNCGCIWTWLCQFCLELYNPNCPRQKIKACKTETDGRVVEGKHQSYTISASSAGERDSWIDAIRSDHTHTDFSVTCTHTRTHTLASLRLSFESLRASITKDPFYDLVSVRKKKVINTTPEDWAGHALDVPRPRQRVSKQLWRDGEEALHQEVHLRGQDSSSTLAFTDWTEQRGTTGTNVLVSAWTCKAAELRCCQSIKTTLFTYV